MKKCKVLIPFIDKETGEFYQTNTEIDLPDERIKEIEKVNVNMILVVSEVQEEPIEGIAEEPKKGKRRTTNK